MTDPILPPPVENREPSPPSGGTKLANKLVILALVAIALIMGVFAYWVSQDERVLDVKTQPFPTRTIREHPTAGGVVFVTADVCKQHSVEGELRISFVSASREVFLPLTKERGEKGCFKTELPVLIPKDIVPDTYRIKFRVTYNINPLKQGIVQTFETTEVVIDPDTPENQLPTGSLPAEQ